MAKHAPQIQLCQACEQALQRIAERGDAGTAWYCEHGAGVLAVVVIQNRAISQWTLEGPISEPQAKDIIEAGMADGLERWQSEQAYLEQSRKGPRH